MNIDLQSSVVYKNMYTRGSQNIPTPMQIKTFHFCSISIDICMFTPLSGFLFENPCNGCLQFAEGFQNIPKQSLWQGHIASSSIPSLVNIPHLAKISSHSELTHLVETFTRFKWFLTSLVQAFMPINSFKDEVEDSPQGTPENFRKEQVIDILSLRPVQLVLNFTGIQQNYNVISRDVPLTTNSRNFINMLKRDFFFRNQTNQE